MQLCSDFFFWCFTTKWAESPHCCPSPRLCLLINLDEMFVACCTQLVLSRAASISSLPTGLYWFLSPRLQMDTQSSQSGGEVCLQQEAFCSVASDVRVCVWQLITKAHAQCGRGGSGGGCSDKAAFHILFI